MTPPLPVTLLVAAAAVVLVALVALVVLALPVTPFPLPRTMVLGAPCDWGGLWQQ